MRELNFEPQSFTVLRHTIYVGLCHTNHAWRVASKICCCSLNLTCVFQMQGDKKRKIKLDIDILIDSPSFDGEQRS